MMSLVASRRRLWMIGNGRVHAEPASDAPPYPGAKPHLLIEADRRDDAEWLSERLRVTAAELPPPKPRKPKRGT